MRSHTYTHSHIKHLVGAKLSESEQAEGRSFGNVTEIAVCARYSKDAKVREIVRERRHDSAYDASSRPS